MSGRAPPRAPRALLNSLASSGATPSSSSATPSSSQPSTSSKIGTTPPTGPRSLSSVGSSKPKHLVNGLNGHNVATIPSSLKGKQVDYSGGFRVISNVALHTPISTQDVNNTQDRLPDPPPPLSEPPPLPSPTVESSSSPPPPPPSFAPPPLPSSATPCPPASVPPPLPPPPSPTSDPPPLPSVSLRPHIAPIAFPKSLKPNSILRSPTTPSEPCPPSLPEEPTPPDTVPTLQPSPPPIPTPSPPPPTPPRSPSPPKLYSLPSPLPWPPSSADFSPEMTDYKVLFDPLVEKDRDGRFRQLMEKIRQLSIEGEPRIKGKSKGKELIYRYGGEVIDGEQPSVVRDPRKAQTVKKLPNLRPGRGEFYTLKYEFDANSTGPPPPTCVLVLNISPLTPNQQIRRHFGVHGRVVSFEPQMDKQTGGALGIVFVKFSTHEEAKKCVERESGGKNIGLGTTLGIQVMPGEVLKVVFDDEAKATLKAVLKELDNRKRREKEGILKKKRDAEAAEKRKKDGEDKSKKEAEAAQSRRGKPTTDPRHVLPPESQHHSRPDGKSPVVPSNESRPPPNLVRARNANSTSNGRYSSRPTLALHDHSSSSTPIHSHRGRSFDRPSDRHYRPSYRGDRYSPSKRSSRSRSRSRSPSPVSRKPGHSSHFSSRQSHRDVVMAELRRNGHDYVSIEEYGGGGQLGGNVKEEDVRKFFEGFKIDKILQDHLGWYVTFQTADSARRASTVLNSGARTLAHRSVTVNVHVVPSSWMPSMSSMPSASRDPSSKAKWSNGDLVDMAEKTIMNELKKLLEKDVVDRVVAVKLRQMVAEEEKVRKLARIDGSIGIADGEEKKERLKGLSFKKNKVSKLEPIVVEEPVRSEDEEDVVDRPKKRRKLEVSREDIESEESDDETMKVPLQDIGDDVKRKRSEVEEFGEPAKKKIKVRSPKKVARKWEKEKLDIATVVIPEDTDFLTPPVDEVRLSDWESSLSPPSSPEPESKPPLLPPLPPPAASLLPDLSTSGLCEDDEDIYFAKLVLVRNSPAKFRLPLSSVSVSEEPDSDSLPPFRVHVTGSARTEGYYKISHSEKSIYVAQYATRTSAQEVVVAVEVPAQPQLITSSRSNRANARRRAQGIEEINQVQRAMKLSLGETPATDEVKFNQLQTRKKHLRFARSPIHDWGLYAMERISRGEMVIEYVGEVIRAQVADKREKAYERQGIGSSYLFRIDEDLVVDATKKGNLGRLINHSCDPNCTAKIITINGEKKIVIYAKQDIELGDEITYDYHFPIEQDKIPCLCGSAKCRGYLN